VTPQREPYTHIRWGDAFRRLTERGNHPIDRDDLCTHLKHRCFGPDDPEAIDTLIDDAVSSGVLDEKEDAVYDLFDLNDDERSQGFRSELIGRSLA
jgi:hypothetical protein